MAIKHHELGIQTTKRYVVVDITKEVEEAVRISGVAEGLCNVFTPHATAAITINESEDPNIGVDFLRALDRIVPEHDGWYHDKVDNNAAAHIKATLVGPSEMIPIIGGKLALGKWQNIFFCELDGPRANRRIIVSIHS